MGMCISVAEWAFNNVQLNSVGGFISVSNIVNLLLFIRFLIILSLNACCLLLTKFVLQSNCRCGRNPLALVLAPTRELARQVEKEFCESSRLDTLCVYGGTPIGRQMTLLSRGVDVVAGTPGRVIDLMKRGALDLSELQFVVLDEADQMLNVGFEEAVEVILEKAPKNRQTLMFSATMPNWILKLTRKYLKDPLTIDLVRMTSFCNIFLFVLPYDTI